MCVCVFVCFHVISDGIHHRDDEAFTFMVNKVFALLANVI